MNIEEKAKQYSDKPTHSRYQKDRRLKFESYKDGYTQAITDLSAEKEKLREALSLLVEKIDAPLESPDEWFDDLFDVATKAKQLITEEK